MTEVRTRLPEWANALFRKARYKAIYGGRGSGKSHSIATALVILAARHPVRVLCAREIQRSIKDSVKRLLDDKIKACGLVDFYDSTDSEIRGKNGSLFVFAGLRTNIDSVKSLEGIDIAWIEEAATVSQSSLNTLVPTIRKAGSEIWFSWNPRFATDPVDAMFRGADGPPPNSIVLEVNHDANPWFDETEMPGELTYDRRRDPDKYQHIWRGAYQRNSEARVFKNWIAEDFETPNDARFYFGADWGFAVDPAVLIRMFIGRWGDNRTPVYDPQGRTLFFDYEAYAVGCEIDDTPALFAGTDTNDPPRWTNPHQRRGVPGATRWPVTADSARPETISYMQRKGFHITPAVKGAGSVEDGVEFLKSYDIVIHPRCRHSIDEFTMYSWEVDKVTGLVLPVLADKNNNVIDAARYGLEGLRRGGGKPEYQSTGEQRVTAALDKPGSMHGATGDQAWW